MPGLLEKQRFPCGAYEQDAYGGRRRWRVKKVAGILWANVSIDNAECCLMLKGDSPLGQDPLGDLE